MGNYRIFWQLYQGHNTRKDASCGARDVVVFAIVFLAKSMDTIALNILLMLCLQLYASITFKVGVPYNKYIL